MTTSEDAATGHRQGSPRTPLIAAAAGVALTALAYMWVRLTPDEQWPTSLLTVLPPWLSLAPTAALLVWAAVARNRAAVGASFFGLLMAATLLGGLCWGTGGREASASSPGVLRVLTWNVCGMHNRARAPQVAQVLRESGADIVCLQEAMQSQFRGLVPGWDEKRIDDIRLISRYPIVDCRRAEMVPGALQGAMVATIRTPAADLQLLSVHFIGSATRSQDQLPPINVLPENLRISMQLREQQTSALLSLVPASGPVIVCGDFNLPPTVDAHQRLRERLMDAFQKTSFGFGLTYMIGERVPAWRIDYVWCGNGVRPVRCRVGPLGLSDHRAVIADVLLPRTAGGQGE